MYDLIFVWGTVPYCIHIPELSNDAWHLVIDHDVCLISGLYACKLLRRLARTSRVFATVLRSPLNVDPTVHCICSLIHAYVRIRMAMRIHHRSVGTQYTQFARMSLSPRTDGGSHGR